MPKYGWRGRTPPSADFPKGVSKGLRTMVEGGTAENTKIEASESEGDTQLFRCLVESCEKTFKAQHLAASHFRGKHVELNAEKESWRSYVGPI